MAAAELVVIMPQTVSAPAAPAAPAAAQTSDLQEPVRQITRQAQQGAEQAAQDMAKEAARRNKTVRIDKDGNVVVESRPNFTPMASGGAFNPFDNSHLIPPQAVDIANGFFTMCAIMVVGWPLARAFGRRLEQRGSAATAIPAGVTDQLQRIEQAVDAMSIEVERISESQRFMAKLQSQAGGEQMALPHDRG